MTANIRLNGVATPLPVLAGVVVSLSNFDNTGVLAWQWTLLDRPATSTASITGGASPVASLTPDVPGTYLVRLRTYKDAGATILDDVSKGAAYVLYVSTPTWRVPAAGETTEVSALRGWADEVNAILAYIQANLGTGGAVGAVRYHLATGMSVVVQPDFEYVVRGLIVDAGATLTVQPGAVLVSL